MRSETIALLLALLALPVTSHAVHAIGVTPSSLAFGSVRVPDSGSLDLTIQNTQGGMLRVDSLVFSNHLFGCAEGIPFNVGTGSKTIQVTFSPSSRGPKGGTLTIYSTDSATPSTVVNLSGTGVAPVVSAPASLDFGTVAVGSATNRSLVVTNNTTDVGQSLMVSSITFSGVDASMFDLTGATFPPKTIAPGANATFTVRYTPSSGGPRVATAEITSDDPLQPTRQVALTGTDGTVGVAGDHGAQLSLSCLGRNPARDEATFDFTLPHAGNTMLAVFDTQGRRVRTLLNGVCPAGRKEARWNLIDQAGRATLDGIYFARLDFGAQTRAVRFVIVR